MMRNKKRVCIRLSLAVLLLCGVGLGSVRADTITTGNSYTLEVIYLTDSTKWQITPITATVSANTNALVTSKNVNSYISNRTAKTVSEINASNNNFITGKILYNYLSGLTNGTVATSGENINKMVTGAAVATAINTAKSELAAAINEASYSVVSGSTDALTVSKNETDKKWTITVNTDDVSENSGKLVTGQAVYDYLHQNKVELGAGSTALGRNSVVLGSENTIGGNATIAIGKKINTSAQNAIVIGGGTDSEITAVADNSVVLGYGSTSEEADTVSVGSATQQRKIVHVAAGKVDTDAVNVGQLKDAMNENRNEMGRALGTLDFRVNDVAAGAAALAALHPTEYNPENKASFAVGYGHYRNANAGAFGAFFTPNEDVTVSLASTIGNGNPMVNAGLSFKIGKRGNAIYAKQDSRIIQKLVTENAEQAKKIETLEADNAQMKAQIAEILKKLELSEKR